MTWRLIKLGDEVDAYTSRALVEALTKSTNTLLLCRHTSPFVGLGKSASISEVNIAFCEENNIPLVRSPVDGGIFLQCNDIEYHLFMDKGFFPNIEIAKETLIDCVVRACQELGLPARQRPNSNDVLVGERKVSGTGLRDNRGILHFGVILGVDFDYELAEKVLKIRDSKFTDKKAKTVREWVTSVKMELGKEVSYEEVEDAIVQGFSSVLGVDFEELAPTVEELEVADRLAEKYKSESWIKYGRWSPVKDYWR